MFNPNRALPSFLKVFLSLGSHLCGELSMSCGLGLWVVNSSTFFHLNMN